MTLLGADSRDDAERTRQFADTRFVQQTLQLIEMLTGVGRDDEAESIRVQAAVLVDDPRFKSPAPGSNKNPK